MNNTKEEWRDVVGYEGLYQVSNKGRVRSMDRSVKQKGKANKRIKGVVLIPEMSCGYHVVTLCKDAETKQARVHRLVASAFLENPQGYPMVNHKDECKTNNNATNLEWCTAEYNSNYGTRNKRVSQSLQGIQRRNLWQPVLGKSKSGSDVVCFDSVTQAGKCLTVSKATIMQALRHPEWAGAGYYWRRVDNWTTELFLSYAQQKNGELNMNNNEAKKQVAKELDKLPQWYILALAKALIQN